MTNVINLIGAPGTGKSTIASELFSIMKWAGMDVELVSEYAKELVWEQRNETFKNELYIFAKQHHRLFRLNNKVDYIVTDRPLILSEFYNKTYGSGSEAFKNIVLEEVDKFNNINIFLNRTKKYVAKGRNETEEESIAFSNSIKNMIDSLGVEYFELDAVSGTTAQEILKLIKQ